MVFEKIKGFFVLLIIGTLLFYLLLIVWNSSPFIDVWPLEGIFWETVAVVLVVTILSCVLFQSRASIIIPLITQVFLIVMIPVLKYPNALNIIGISDSSAHFSFAKWIVVNGYVDTAGNLFYSDDYGVHPGNGVIPATLSVLSSISLGWSMNIVLITIYSVFMLFLLATLKAFKQFILKNMGVTSALWLIAVSTLAVNLPVYYGGVELGYAYAAGILYILVKWLTGKEVTPIKSVMVVFLIFWGLILTHYSTAFIVTAYALIVVSALFIVGSFNKRFRTRRSSLGLLVLAFSMISIFITYEIYVDVFLFRNTVRGALSNVYSLYIREVETASTAMNVKGLSFIDLLRFLISYYAKIIIVLGLILVHTVMLLVKWRSLSSSEKMVALLLFASYPSWLIGWGAVGSFLTGARAQSVICFLLALSLALTHERLYRFLIKRGTLVIPLILVSLGFITNFGLPFMPAIKGGADLYTYPTFSQGGFSDYVLHPTTYMSSYASITSPPFLCLGYYTSFGLCDLMWQAPKIPRHGSLGHRVTSPDSIIEHIKNYLNESSEGVIVPQPLRDRLLFGPIGYQSFYEKPFQLLLEKGKALIYNNGLYTIFLVQASKL